MVIRPVLASDFAAIAELTNHWIKNTVVHFGIDPVTPDELRQAWAKHCSTHPYLVLEVNGAFAGYAKAGVWRERAAYQWSAETGIYLHMHLHGKGHGKALYSRLLADMRTAGFHSALGGITLPNPASVRLHESLGFRKVAEIPEAGYKFAAWHSIGFWQLMLQDGAHTPRPTAV